MSITWTCYAFTASGFWSNTRCVFGEAREKSFKLGVVQCIEVLWHFQAPAVFDRDQSLWMWGQSGPAACKKIKLNGELLPLFPEQCPKHRQDPPSRKGVYTLEVQKPEIQPWLCLTAGHKTCRDKSTARTSSEVYWIKFTKFTKFTKFKV